jgi:hypothetical protein
MSSSNAPPDPPAPGDLLALVLNRLPGEGMTLPQLIEATNADPARAEEAVRRLRDMGAIEIAGDVIHSTPFVQKARKFFHFVA